MSFSELGLAEPILRAVVSEGYTTPTPIQSQSIPQVIAGRDLLGCAQTGTGKTAAFALPILHRLDAQRRPAVSRSPRVLILSPTRELAAQIGESFATYGRNLHFRQTTIFGGVGQHPQVRALNHGVHVLIATPGRLLDLMQQGHVRLDQLEIFVLDEADRMLDMGFMPDLKRIIAKLPTKRQSLFFSATMPETIASLARGLLTDPVRVTVTPPSTTVELIEQRVMFVDRGNKRALLNALLGPGKFERVLVFTRTKHGADKVVDQLEKEGIAADAIHGNKSQSARQRALSDFRRGKLRVLVATDIASRGIDVDGISHVINYDLPTEPEAYVHRIGRTGRAGAEGVALSFCDSSERGSLRAIEQAVRKSIEVETNHPFHVVGSEKHSNRPSNGHSPRFGAKGGNNGAKRRKPFGSKPGFQSKAANKGRSRRRFSGQGSKGQSVAAVG
jgi:ATP-dependent RNA helicase RhlE